MNKQLERAIATLRKCGYRQQSTTAMRSGGRLLIFTGPKGAVIVQTFPNASDGVTMYADWPLGTTWEAIEIALTK